MTESKGLFSLPLRQFRGPLRPEFERGLRQQVEQVIEPLRRSVAPSSSQQRNIVMVDERLRKAPKRSDARSNRQEAPGGSRPDAKINGSSSAVGVGYVPATFIPEPVRADEDFQREVSRVSKAFNIAEDDLYRVIYFETEKSMRPDQKGGNSSATGLIQFMTGEGDWATSKGLSREGLSRMTRAEQMKYVEQFLKDNGLGKVEKPTIDDIYLTIFNPSLVGKPDNYVHGRRGQDKFGKNPYFDPDGDGVTYRHEITSQVRNYPIAGYGAYKAPKLHTPPPAGRIGMPPLNIIRRETLPPVNPPWHPKPTSRDGFGRPLRQGPGGGGGGGGW